MIIFIVKKLINLFIDLIYINIMYKPIIFRIPNTDNSFLNKDSTNIKISTSINQPLLSLGFHSFLHRTKNGMSITKTLETKNKFYYIVNPFEHEINDFKDDINNKVDTYFKDNKVKIISRAFYKLWEILIYFDVASKKDLKYAGIAEAPGSFVQAVLKFREKFNLDIKNNNLYTISIHPENGNYLTMSKQFLGHYNEKYNNIINNHKTYTFKSSNKYKSRDNGDITQLKSVSLFKSDVLKKGKYMDLITADGGFNWEDENFQEQEAYSLILGEILAAIQIQEKGGHFILKIFETFTLVTIKLIYLLSSYYDECYLYKPFFSRSSNSEKYLICKNFKYDNNSKEIKTSVSILETMLKNMDTKLFVNDIFSDLKLPIEFLNMFKYININIANNQQVIINKMITYIKGNNYFGEEYHTYRENQINANEWWSKNFFIEKYDEKINTVKESSDFNDSEIKLFVNNLQL